MAASQIWMVKNGATIEAAFKASKALYTELGSKVGIVAVPADSAKSTPTYSIGELLKVGWLVPINVYFRKSTNKIGVINVYCAPDVAEAFLATCREEPSTVTVNGMVVTSASRPRKQSFS